MGFVDKTPEGRYRAYFRDPTGKQRSRTFKVKKDATAFLAEMETSKSRGTYVSPPAGRTLFGEHARRWMETRNTEAMTTAGTARSSLRTSSPAGGMSRSVESTTSGSRGGLQSWVVAAHARPCQKHYSSPRRCCARPSGIG